MRSATLAGLFAVSSLGLAGCDPVGSTLARLNPLVSFESRCEALPATRIDVKQTDFALSQDFSVPYRMLETMSENSSVSHRTVGLTKARFGYRSEVELGGIEDLRQARVCTRPIVHVELSISPVTIYVASEYRGDPCREPRIIEHEMKHVDVQRTYANEAVGSLRRKLQAAFGTHVHYAKSMDDSKAAIQKTLGEVLEGFLEESRGILSERQARVDTRAEYERLARECGAGPVEGAR